jgi:mevalonate kinase
MSIHDETFYSNGKLLLTGEYVVLDGALSLAVPTRYGQSLSVTGMDSSHEMGSSQLIWHSLDHNGSVWFRGVFDLRQLFGNATPNPGGPIEKTLIKILREARRMNPDFLKGTLEKARDGIGKERDGIGNGKDGPGHKVTTQLDFPRDWGLGSSSTLINNIAQWAEVDAYTLLWNSFSGSGYDIACARHDHAITYRLERGNSIHRAIPRVRETDFDPPFRDQLYFVHLNKKQNSREGIANYRQQGFNRPGLVQRISEITRKAISCKTLKEFETLMTEHEALISKTLRIPTVKESFFPDYPGAVKSLGAWGGDFVLAMGNDGTPSYFRELGYDTVVPYSKMVLGTES